MEIKDYIGRPVSWNDLKCLAIRHGKQDIVVKLYSLNPEEYDLFFSDGCSMWPDEWRIWNKKYDLSTACFWHDIRYYLGGPTEERQTADAQLYSDVFMLAGFLMARTMYAGVRVGGWIPGTGFEWGYGRLKK